MVSAIAKNQLQPFIQIAWENRNIVYGVAAVMAIILTLVWAIYVGNSIVSWSCVIFVAVAWSFTGAFCATYELNRRFNSARRRLVRATEAISGLSLISLFVAAPAPFAESVWVMPDRDVTSFSRTYFLVSPLSMPRYYTVSFSQATSAVVDVVTKDGIPLTCMTSARGINLDRRNIYALEGFLLEIAVTRDPNSHFDREVKKILASGSATALANRTTEEIRRQGTFVIPYEIGSPVAATLAKNVLRWQDGTVSFSCELKKFQS